MNLYLHGYHGLSMQDQLFVRLIYSLTFRHVTVSPPAEISVDGAELLAVDANVNTDDYDGSAVQQFQKSDVDGADDTIPESVQALCDQRFVLFELPLIMAELGMDSLSKALLHLLQDSTIDRDQAKRYFRIIEQFDMEKMFGRGKKRCGGQPQSANEQKPPTFQYKKQQMRMKGKKGKKN